MLKYFFLSDGNVVSATLNLGELILSKAMCVHSDAGRAPMRSNLFYVLLAISMTCEYSDENDKLFAQALRIVMTKLYSK
jgi:hypothetical protein